MIGEKLYKDTPEDMARYTEVATWCNENGACIVDNGEYYEVCEQTPIVPTKEEQIANLTEVYAAEKSNLCEAYTAATMQGDTETAQSVAADLADLDAWYDEEYQKIEEAV